MDELDDLLNPENWTTTELFEYCQTLHIISSDDKFEDWMYDRPDLLQLVKNDIANNISSVDLQENHNPNKMVKVADA